LSFDDSSHGVSARTGPVGGPLGRPAAAQLGRPGWPTEAAELVAFPSERAASITGSEYVIDGGAMWGLLAWRPTALERLSWPETSRKC
jgi:hypothetical protein